MCTPWSAVNGYRASARPRSIEQRGPIAASRRRRCENRPFSSAYGDSRITRFAQTFPRHSRIRRLLHNQVCPDISSSFPRKREGGFTFEVQHMVPEYLGGGLIVQALTWGIVVSLEQGGEMVIGQASQVSLSRKGSAQTADGILDSAFLPGRMGIAEESLDSQGMEVIVASERCRSKVIVWRQGWGKGPKMLEMALALGPAALPGGRSARRSREWRSWRVRTA